MREKELQKILRAEREIEKKLEELESAEETEHKRYAMAGYYLSLGYLAGLRGENNVF